MAETLPSFAKVSELRMRVAYADDVPRSAMTLRLQGAVKLREVWAVEIAFARLAASQAQELLAFFERVDGRAVPWIVPAKVGITTQSPSHTATLTAATVAGQDFINLTVSPAAGTLVAGTMVSLGTIGSDSYQALELLDTVDVPASGKVSVGVAPRLRYVFASGATVNFATPALRLKLASDAAGEHTYSISHGVVSVSAIESLTGA